MCNNNNHNSSMFNFNKKPFVLFFIGMAGSGKTTLVYRISLDLSFLKKNHYIINIDPASSNVPYAPNIDIRDTIDYKKIMKEYSLGPNGAIITSLNLFATRFEQVKNIININCKILDYLIVDTPGQIEVFTWSASGSIICETFSSSFPVTFLYIVDISRAIYPLTFVSNILYSCSVLYKSRLPLMMILNKVDITSADFLREWLNDTDMFDKALEKEDFFAGSFARSLASTLECFYQRISFSIVSSLNGFGIFQLLNTLKKIYLEFLISYQKELEKNLINHIINLKEHIKKNKNKIFCKYHSKLNNFESFLSKKEESDYLKTIEFIIHLKIEEDKIYLIELSDKKRDCI
nr:ATP/GTP-bp [Cryptomonas curvata]